MTDPQNPTATINQGAAVQLFTAESATTVQEPDQEIQEITTVPPIVLPKNTVSGRYRGSSGAFELELRVDIDAQRPLNLVSGDYYQVLGGVRTYFGSYKSTSINVTWTAP